MNICSAHQFYEPNCETCNTVPPNLKEEYDRLLKEYKELRIDANLLLGFSWQNALKNVHGDPEKFFSVSHAKLVVDIEIARGVLIKITELQKKIIENKLPYIKGQLDFLVSPAAYTLWCEITNLNEEAKEALKEIKND